MASGQDAVGLASRTTPAARDLPPFAVLRAFDAVARLGGVRKAAEALGIDHTVVSRHLRTLEAWAGVSLVERTRTSVLLNEAGRDYAAKIAKGIDLLAEASLDLRKRSDDGHLQIWSMPGFAFRWLMARLNGFQSANPAIRVELRPSETSPDFSLQEADVDIRYVPVYGPSPTLPATLRSTLLETPLVIPVASPAYLANAGPIRAVGDLVDHALIHEESFENWRAWLAGQGLTELGDLPGQRFWQAHLTMEAARHGGGVVLANRFLVGDDLASGALVEVTGEQGAFAPVTLGAYVMIARADRWASPPIARFRHWLLDQVAAERA